MPQTLHNTLYLLTPGLSLRRDGLAMRIEQEGKLKLSLPVHNLESVFVFGADIYVSPSAMRLCWERGVSVCYFTEWGRLEARVEGVPYGSVTLRRKQHEVAADGQRALMLGRAFVAGKLHNTRWLVGRSARDASDEGDKAALGALNNVLAHLIRGLPEQAEPDDVRGLEGRAAALHFSEFHRHLRPAIREQFPVDGRSRRPPRDSVNCLLSFLYALLRHDCISALTAVGLDPFVGFLHTERAGRESLALDLMEEFRPWVERLAITMLNRGELKPADFIVRDGGAVELGEKTRKSIVAAYQSRKREEIIHPLFEQKVLYAQLPFIQARLLARCVRGDLDVYTPYLFS
jgi:CRISPR-associated protein Cas1